MKNRFVLISLLILTIQHTLKAQKVSFFDGVEFDDSSSIIGFPSGSNPEQNRQLAFIVNNQKDFDQLRLDWIFEAKSFGKKPDNSLAIYKVKNKIGEWIGTIYPGINKITTVRGSYIFDTSRLALLAKKHPFHYQIKKEIFKNREEYLIQYSKALNMQNYLFSFGSGRWDGTFKISIPSSDSINTPVAAINMLEHKLSNITNPGNYSIRYELSGDNIGYAKSFKITVDCVEYLYDHYNDQVYVKSDWKPELIFMTSFWKE
jgi:hypothetical protein